MIRKEKGEFVVECSDCGTEEYGGVVDNFREFVELIKERNWKAVKDESTNQWEHYCPECREQWE